MSYLKFIPSSSFTHLRFCFKARNIHISIYMCDVYVREKCIFFFFCESEVAQSYRTPSDSMDCSLPGSSVHGTPGKSTGVGCHCLLQEVYLLLPP